MSKAIQTLDDLLDEYFGIAYQQGKEGRNHDDIKGSAQETIDKIRACFANRPRIQVALQSAADTPEPPSPQTHVVGSLYGWAVELRSVRSGKDLMIARSRVQPSIAIANACVDSWKRIYTADHWRFVIVELYHSPAPQSNVLGVTLSAETVIAIRDALIGDSVEEAYHQLYSAIDPDFVKLEPWAQIEAAALSPFKAKEE